MTSRTLLVLKAAVCLFFGILMLAVPGPCFALLGGTLTAAGRFAPRVRGGNDRTLFLTWLARNIMPATPVRRILLDLSGLRRDRRRQSPSRRSCRGPRRASAGGSWRYLLFTSGRVRPVGAAGRRLAPRAAA